MVADQTPIFIKHLYTVKTKQEFIADLDCFLQYFESVSLQKTIESNTRNRKIIKPSFHITFDDGLANFYHIIAPILKQKNIHATVFLNTDFIDNKDLFYRYKVSLLIERYQTSDTETQKIFKKFAYDKTKQKDVKSFLLNINFKQKEWLNQLAKQINYSFSDFLKTKKPYLSTKQIKELQKQGFTFGAHSKNHPLYQNLSITQQILQTKDSINWLQNNLDIKYKAFAFPFYDCGIKTEFFNQIKKEIDIGFGTSGLKNDTILFNLQRLDMEKNNVKTKRYLIKNYIKYLLQKAINKHQVKR